MNSSYHPCAERAVYTLLTVDHVIHSCTARGFGGAPRRPPVAGRRRAQTPPSRPFALRRDIAGWTQACN